MKKLLICVLIFVCFKATAQRMLVLPDTPRFANQNKGVFVLRTADNLPYYSNGYRWVSITAGAVTPSSINDSLNAYNLRNVTSYNGLRGAVRGTDTIYINSTEDTLKWRIAGVTYNAAIGGGGAGVTDGDKGDVIVSGTGSVWQIKDGALILTQALKDSSGKIASTAYADRSAKAAADSNYSTLNAGQFTGTGSITKPISINPANDFSIIGNRLINSKHTAFGLSGVLNGKNLVIIQSESVGHAQSAGTKGVSFVSTDRGATYQKYYLPLTGIVDSATSDIRNFAGGVNATGDTLYIIGTEYLNAAEVLPTRIWFWKTADGVTFTAPVQISYNTTTYPQYFTSYGDMTVIDTGVYIIPAYTARGALNESYAIQLKTVNFGQTWAVSTIGTGDNTSGSNQYTETDIEITKNGLLLACIRREVAKPVLYHSSDSGATWVYDGIITNAASTLSHAPYFYKYNGTISLLISDRVHNNILRLDVPEDSPTLAKFNAARREIVGNTVLQQGVGNYNFGYCSVAFLDKPYMVWYDVGINETNWSDLSSQYTDIMLTPLVEKPMFKGGIIDALSFPSGGSEGTDILLSQIAYDNDGMLDTSKTFYIIPEDGLYLVTGIMKVAYNGGGTRSQMNFTVKYPTSAFKKVLVQAENNVAAINILNLTSVINLRKGDKVSFDFYHNDSGTKAVVLDDFKPVFSIIKM